MIYFTENSVLSIQPERIDTETMKTCYPTILRVVCGDSPDKIEAIAVLSSRLTGFERFAYHLSLLIGNSTNLREVHLVQDWSAISIWECCQRYGLCQITRLEYENPTKICLARFTNQTTAQGIVPSPRYTYFSDPKITGSGDQATYDALWLEFNQIQTKIEKTPVTSSPQYGEAVTI